MPEAEVFMVDHLSNMEGRMDDMSYVQRMERDETEKRMNMLFRPDGEKEAASFDANSVLDEAYETVNEGNTTDTSSGLDGDSLLARSQGATKIQQETTAEKSASKLFQPKKIVEEGIMSSSDGEEQETETAPRD